MPIEPMMLVEASVLFGDDSVLQIGRDLAERHKFVAFDIRLVVHPGLQTALDMHGGCWRIDPSGGHQSERGKQPQSRNS